MSAEIQWTFSQLKTFQTCPRQYLHKYILRDIPFVQSEAAKFGDEVHDAIENLVKKHTPIPDRFKQFERQVAPVLAWPGDKYAERKMALDSNLQPCDYYSPEYFVRGKADFMAINGARARTLDWKTGGNLKYAETKQNELMALMIFKLHPEVEVVSAGLVFLMLDRVVKSTYRREDEKKMWQWWLMEVERIKQAKQRNNFGPNPGGLCKAWCDVPTCEHNKKFNV